MNRGDSHMMEFPWHTQHPWYIHVHIPSQTPLNSSRHKDGCVWITQQDNGVMSKDTAVTPAPLGLRRDMITSAGIQGEEDRKERSDNQSYSKKIKVSKETAA